MRKAVLASCLSVILLIGGCSVLKGTNASVSGAANSFDSTSYLTLVTTDSVIQTTKTDFANNAFPANIAGNVKTALNDLIQSYNVANVTYQAYHTAALANTATAAQQTAVSSALATVQTKTAALTTAKAGS